jgi:carbon monoxide dehydrogenase subunit G
MADRTMSSITVAASRADVMAVIADFASYPEWATGVRSAEVVASDGDGRATLVRFQLDAGVIKDSYVLSYDWDADADAGVRWDLAEPGSVITALSGGYLLADADGGTEVTYDLAVDVRIPMLGMLKRRAEKTIIDTALKGLRGRAESGEGDGT